MKPKKAPGADDTAYWRKFWGVTPRAIQLWRKDGTPFTDTQAMADRSLTAKHTPQSVRDKLAALGLQATSIPTSPTSDPDWAAYLATKNADGKSTAAALSETVEDFRGLYAFKLRNATAAGHEARAKFLTQQLIVLDRAIRDNKLAEKKLGLEVGTTITRADAERWFRAFGFWTMRGVDLMLDAMIPRITALSPALTYEIVRKAIEPAIIEARLFRPYVQATRVASRSNLPDWALDAIRDTVDDYVEKGAESFDESFKKP